MNRRSFLNAAACIAVTGCFRSQPEQKTTAHVDELLDLMNKRLAVMLDVARAKWNTKSQTEDAAREKALLASMTEAGREYALDPAFTTAFFAAQIEAAKIIQRAAFAEWEAEKCGTFQDAPDLVRDLRPKIDGINRELVAALAKYKRGGQIPSAELHQHAEMQLMGPGVTSEVRAVAVKPLEGGPT